MEYVGSQEVELYIKKYGLKPDREIGSILQHSTYQKRPWASFASQRFATKEAVDLLARMLVVDHSGRISSEDALQHPFFTME
jgi:serine/threonine protein kinase